MENKRMETWQAGQECRVQKRITELHTRNITSRQWSGTQACHNHHASQRDGSSARSIDWKRYVKDKWVNQGGTDWQQRITQSMVAVESSG